MSLRVTCTTDAEIALCLDIGDQLTGMFVLVWQRELCILRDVAAKCQDVLELMLFLFCDHRSYLLLV